MKYKLKDGERYGLPKQVEAFQYNGVLSGEPWVTKAFNDGGAVLGLRRVGRVSAQSVPKS